MLYRRVIIGRSPTRSQQSSFIMAAAGPSVRSPTMIISHARWRRPPPPVSSRSDYRLAPEYPFPAAVDDAWAALTGIAPNGPLFVAGDSAGGNLAAVVSQRARDESLPKLAGQILIYPSVAGTVDTPEMHAFVPPMMPRDDITAYYDLYVPDRMNRRDPRFAPALGEVTNLPPAIVITAGADLLAAEAEAYAEALQAAGNDVTLHRQEGALHAYLTLLPDTAASKSTMSEIVGFVARRVVESGS